MDISLTSIGSIIAKVFHRYGLIMFFVFIALGLVIGLLMLNRVIAQTDQPDGYVSSVNSITFDESTIEKVNGLKQSSEQTDRIVPNGRSLPF